MRNKRALILGDKQKNYVSIRTVYFLLGIGSKFYRHFFFCSLNAIFFIRSTRTHFTNRSLSPFHAIGRCDFIGKERTDRINFISSAVQ